MKSQTKKAGIALAVGALFGSAVAIADGDKGHTFEVTVTNITGNEIFTPILVAAHKRGLSLFSVGEPASSELEQLAEGGDTGPLKASLLAAGAADVVTADGVLPPGDSVTLHVTGGRAHNYISVTSMLVPSNDAFFAANAVRVPRHGRSVSVYSPAYDAGTELNDELCVNIPGPPTACAGEGYNTDGGEGYVYIHPGIHGVGDLAEGVYDWHNPVAKITIREVR